MENLEAQGHERIEAAKMDLAHWENVKNNLEALPDKIQAIMEGKDI